MSNFPGRFVENELEVILVTRWSGKLHKDYMEQYHLGEQTVGGVGGIGVVEDFVLVVRIYNGLGANRQNVGSLAQNGLYRDR